MRAKTSVIVAASTMLCAAMVSAQTPMSYKVDQLTSVSMPQTAITVGLVVTKTTVKAGPYARFAQKYLGIVAPLADKKLYAIKGATIGYVDPMMSQSGDASVKIMATPAALNENFDLITSDRMSAGLKSPEEMARDAANQIFILRQRRFDLITGEAGENVFGAGLESALKEMGKLENELLALFVGKETVSSELKTYKIVPSQEKHSYIVARFSETDGLLSDSDLSGTPIMLSVNADPIVATNVPKKEAKVNDYYQVAAMATCKVIFGTTIIVSDRVPVYQLGKLVSLPAPSSK